MRGVEKVWKDTDNDTGLDNDCEEEARLPVESDERGLYVHGGEVPYWTAGRVNKEFDEYIAAKMWTGRVRPIYFSRPLMSRADTDVLPGVGIRPQQDIWISTSHIP